MCAASVFAQVRGGGGSSTSRVVSPAVVASWRSYDNYADGSSSTLLVLWRGTPGWFAGRGRGEGSSSGSGGGGGGSYQFFTYAGRTFTMDFDNDRKVVKLLNQEVSLKDVNVILVDFVDSASGATIVGYRRVEPGPPAPPALDGARTDPIAAIIQRSPELYEYLRCDLPVGDPIMKAMMPIICGQMRGELVQPGSQKPR